MAPIGMNLGAEITELDSPNMAQSVDDGETSLQSLVKAAVEEGLQWREENLDPDQAEATDYYMGRPFGNEKEGRSQVVMTIVRDAVMAVMPSLLRMFFSSDTVVEFEPFGSEDIDAAKQQTDSVNYYIRKGGGFLTFHSLFKDALIRKIGFAKYYWEEKIIVEGRSFTGQSAAAVAIIESEEGVEILDDTLVSYTERIRNPLNPLEFADVEVFDFDIKRTVDKGQVRIDAVPQEELVWSPSAKSFRDAPLVAHIREVSADELVAMGVDEDLVEKHKGKSHDTHADQLEAARRVDSLPAGDWNGGEDEQDDATRPIRYGNIYMRVDEDGDGIAELLHIETIGDSYRIIDEPVYISEVPIAAFPLDPEPHTIVGLSLSDYVKDLQRIASSVMRGMLDSLGQAINPMQTILEDDVNYKDLLNSEVGRYVRVTRPDAIQTINTPFMGREALPVLQYLSEVQEQRTGHHKEAGGLDADALQSATKQAVAATLSAAQQRVELYARIFAETGMMDLFRGVNRLLIENKTQPETIRLRNQWVEVDPRSWEADRDVIVNVALGAAMPEDKIENLRQILAEQKEQLLAGSPLVSFVEYRRTLGKLIEMTGERDSAEFFRPWSLEDQRALEERASQQPPEIPPEIQVTAEVEREKTRQRQAEAQLEAQLKKYEIDLRQEREREKMLLDFALRQAELGVKANETDLKAAKQLLEENTKKFELALDLNDRQDMAAATQAEPELQE